MGAFFDRIKVTVKSFATSASAGFRRNRVVVLGGLTVLSLLLVVWARAGFTFQIGRFFAAEPLETVTPSSALGFEPTLSIGSDQHYKVSWLTAPGQLSFYWDELDLSCSFSATPAQYVGILLLVDDNDAFGDINLTVPYGTTVTIRRDCTTRRSEVGNFKLDRTSWSSNTITIQPQVITEVPPTSPTPTPVTPMPTPTPGTQPPPLPGGSNSGGGSGGSSGGGTPSASALTVQCSGNTAVLNWTLPANANSNSIQKFDGTNWNFIFQSTVPGATTYTDSTGIVGAKWRHKSGASVVSNEVSCGSTVGPTQPGATDPNPPAAGTIVAACTGGATPTITVRWSKQQPPGAAAPSLNTLIRNLDGADGVVQDASKILDRSTSWQFTDTQVQSGHTYAYRAKYSSAVATSNVATLVASPENCGAVTPTPMPTPAPSSTPTPTVTPTSSPVAAAALTIAPWGMDLSSGGVPGGVVQAREGHVLELGMVIRNTSIDTIIASHVMARAVLPAGFTYIADSTSVNGSPVTPETITTTGIDLGALSGQQEVKVLFQARISAGAFNAGSTQVSTLFIASATGIVTSAEGSVTIVITKPTTSGQQPGGVSTGPGDAAFVALLVSVVTTMMYVSYTRSTGFRRREANALAGEKTPMDFRG